MASEVVRVNANFEREPLRVAFGFKGGYVSELWQAISYLEDREGRAAVGLGTQSVLWSDASVFTSHSEAGGNALMFAVTDWALQRAQGSSFDTPFELLNELLPKALEYARQITGQPELRPTFALNALVGIDFAAWLLFAQSRGVGRFDDMIPEPYRASLGHRHEAVALVPTVGFGMSDLDIERTLQEGHFCLKIKLGHPGDQQAMLKADMERLSQVHGLAADRESTHSPDGHILYYLDANGRYDGKDAIRRLLDHADSIGALERIILLEEPFSETSDERVDDLGVRVAADESAHTDADAQRRIDQGYGAIALKPVAKTLSMTLKIARVAYEHDVPCFCADLTVNPILVEWNKAVAARLKPLPGLDVGLLEANGRQHYLNWARMEEYHPQAGAGWMETAAGMFRLDENFYETDGGIFEPSSHYVELVRMEGSE